MWHRIRALARKEFLHWRRDRLLTPFIFFGPLLLLVLVAGAVSTETDHLPMAVLDRDGSRLSRRLVEGFRNAQTLDPRYTVEREEDLAALLDAGKVYVAMVIPQGFQRDLLAGREPVPVQFLVDGTNSIISLRFLSTISGVVVQLQRDLWAENGIVSGVLAPRIEVCRHVHWNENLDIGYRAIPAQLGLIVYIVTMLVSALGIARERELGTLEQLMIAPLTRLELYVGKAIPAVVIGLVDFLAMLALVRYHYGIPLRGGLGALVGVTFLFILVELGMGMAISAISHSQQQALLFVFLVGISDMAFSGYLVAVENMPLVLGFLSNFFPLRHYLSLVRDI
ncbi:MAG: ABC transporter permease, partial [Anaerolineae bacterium]|nr:ABC transporter permease [Anaerolineae bacterium]